MTVADSQDTYRHSRLRFSSLADYLAHLDHLERFADVRSSGSWTPAQILHHLATAFELSCEQRPSGQRAQSRLLKWPIRFVVLRRGIPRGRPMPSEARDALTPPEDVSLAEQLTRLRQGISAFQAVTHELPIHPVLGELTKDEWRRFHLRHGELHLGHIVMADLTHA